jgi:CheY-like chemotaxis protein
MASFKGNYLLAAGDKCLFTSGPYAAEQGTIKEFDIVGLENLGWRCSVELTTGEHSGRLVSAFTGQLKRIDDKSAIPRKTKILVVEDDPDTQFLICTLLRIGGFEAIAVSDGGEAIKFLESCRPDVILTDLMMPRVSGLELLRFLKEDPLYSDIPVVVITAYGDHNTDIATKAGALRVLNKPAAIEHIAHTMSEVIH